MVDKIRTNLSVFYGATEASITLENAPKERKGISNHSQHRHQESIQLQIKREQFRDKKYQSLLPHLPKFPPGFK